MALTYGFYNSIAHDRLYTALQFSKLFDGIIQDGIFMSIGTAFVVEENVDMTVNVGVGKAWFNHTWTENDAILPLTLDAAHSTLNRYDAIVIEIDSTEAVRANDIKIVKGTAASEPEYPELSNTDYIHQYPLCYIYVGAAVTSITQANITNMVGETDTPYITGILDTIDISSMVAQWEAEFLEWFETIVDILDSETAGNLLNLINARLPLAGGTMTGNILLAGAPTADLHPASKLYADTTDAPILEITGNTTLTASHIGKDLVVTAEAIITIPEGTVLPVGSSVVIYCRTADGVTITGASNVYGEFPGATSALLISSNQKEVELYSSAVLKHISENYWSIQGNIV